jgi:hypothetical protein
MVQKCCRAGRDSPQCSAGVAGEARRGLGTVKRRGDRRGTAWAQRNIGVAGTALARFRRGSRESVSPMQINFTDKRGPPVI